MQPSFGNLPPKAMPTGFHILEIHQQDHALIAVLPMSRMMGQDVGSLLDADFDLLAKAQASVVILDLRQLKFADSHFLFRILRFKKALDSSSGDLSLCVAGNLKEVLRVSKLDRWFKIIDHINDGNSQIPDRPPHQSS